MFDVMPCFDTASAEVLETPAFAVVTDSIGISDVMPVIVALSGWSHTDAVSFCFRFLFSND